MTTYIHKLTAENSSGISLNVKVFRVLLAVFCALMLSYLFFVGNITFSIVSMKAIENESKAIQSSIGELELNYLSLSSNITLEYAQSLGYSEAQKVHFAKNDQENSLTLR